MRNVKVLDFLEALISLLIHSAGPQTRQVVIIVFVRVVSPHFSKSNKFQAKTMFATGETVGLAEWIIDNTCLVLHFFQGLRCQGRNDCCSRQNPCQLYDGNCETDNQCQGDLICVRKRYRTDACIAFYDRRWPYGHSYWTDKVSCCSKLLIIYTYCIVDK